MFTLFPYEADIMNPRRPKQQFLKSSRAIAPQVRVLQKEPKGRDVNDSDVFVFNHDFTAKLHRIKINSIQLKETTEENEKTHQAVFRDRQYQVRAYYFRSCTLWV